MAKKLTKQDCINVIYGATVLGAGGGGSPQCGIDMLENFIKAHGDLELEMISTSEMDPTAYAAVTAGMGSPVALKDKDFTMYGVNSYNALVEHAAKMGRKLSYAIPVEMGGFNTFVPMLIAAMNKIPVVDCDGAARAVPALDTLLLHVNGLETSPLAMADNKNNRLIIELGDPRDAAEGENIGRNICVAFNMMAGLSGWMVTKDQIEAAIGNGTVTRAMKVGECMDNYKKEKAEINFYDYLAANSELKAKGVCRGKITKVDVKVKGGFDYGTAVIAGEDGSTYEVLLQNESLVMFKDGEVLMTAPDIISFYDIEAQVPLTNADTVEGQYVDIGFIEVDERWWKQGEDYINEIWKPYFNNVDYSGKIVRYPN